MTQQRSPRKSRQQWQGLIKQWQHSGQSARDFCQSQGLVFTTFCKWRRLLADPKGVPDKAPTFVDLGALAQAGIPGRWEIVLSLGHGVELRLSQV